MQAIILTGCTADEAATIMAALMRARHGLPVTSGEDVDKIAEELAKESKPFLDRLFDRPSES